MILHWPCPVEQVNLRVTARLQIPLKLIPVGGERVALGHFHERVGESPLSYEYFGTSGSKKSCFVSEIRPFKVEIAVRPNFTM